MPDTIVLNSNSESEVNGAPGTQRRVYIRTFGCQMNVYDTGKMEALLAQDGYVTTEDMSDADLVIVNTCSIREKPELKVHSFLGEARKIKRLRDRDMTIAISG